jgi:signal peptidase I
MGHGMTIETTTEKKKGGLKDTIILIVEALLIAVVIRTFLFQPFNIPSPSMVNTLLVGDYLFVSKYSYGYSRHSFPFSFAPIDGRVWSAEPRRGDVAVFKLPADDETDYIKRVIGLPGDRIQVRGGVLHINGQAVRRERAGTFQARAPGSGPRGPLVDFTRYRETLPDGRTHDIIEFSDNSSADNTREYLVPAGHYFMMGDNRDDSLDSRFEAVGFVPAENFVGRAEIIFFSMTEDGRAWQLWNWPWTVRWNRLFSGIR